MCVRERESKKEVESSLSITHNFVHFILRSISEMTHQFYPSDDIASFAASFSLPFLYFFSSFTLTFCRRFFSLTQTFSEIFGNFSVNQNLKYLLERERKRKERKKERERKYKYLQVIKGLKVRQAIIAP